MVVEARIHALAGPSSTFPLSLPIQARSLRPHPPWTLRLGFSVIRDSLCLRNAFPAVQKICKIVIRLYLDYSSAQFIFMHAHLDLRSSCTLGRRMGTGEGTLLLGVSELLNLEDLKFPILLGEREDTGNIGPVRSAMGRAYGCVLRHG
jgi:hypothetical protein